MRTSLAHGSLLRIRWVFSHATSSNPPHPISTPLHFVPTAHALSHRFPTSFRVAPTPSLTAHGDLSTTPTATPTCESATRFGWNYIRNPIIQSRGISISTATTESNSNSGITMATQTNGSLSNTAATANKASRRHSQRLPRREFNPS